VSDFQKMQVVVQKNAGQTIPQLCHISPARDTRQSRHEKQLMKRKDASGATESWD
jgi:hypothetical protein